MKKIKQIINNPLFSGSAIMILGSNGASALNYIYHFVVGRMLGPAKYGELTALISLIGLFGVISLGLSLSVTKYVSSTKDIADVNNLNSWLKRKFFTFFVLFTVIILFLSPSIASFLNMENTGNVMLIALLFLFSFSSGINRAILQGLLKFKQIIISILLENGLKLLISVLLIILGFQVGGAVMGFVLASIFGWFLTSYFLKSNNTKDPKKPEGLNKIVYFTIPVMIQSLAITSFYTTDVILVKHFFSSYEAGLYASISTLGRIIFFATSPISAVMFPIISQRLSKGVRFEKIFFYSLLATVFLSGLIIIFYGLFPQLAINLLYGSAYLESAHLLGLFGIFMTLFSISSLYINYGLSLGKTKIVFFPAAAALIQVVIIWFNHQSLEEVVLISIVTASLLLLSLIIYSKVRFSYGNNTSLNNSSSL